MCFKKSNGKYENAVKKIPTYELKYYKCFGWKPVNERFEESSDWEYLSVNNFNFDNSFFREYREKIDDDEIVSYDNTRLISVRLNEKIVRISDMRARYNSFFNHKYPLFNAKRKRRRQILWRLPLDLILFALFALIMLVAASLSPLLNGLIPSSLGENFLSFFNITQDALPNVAYTVSAVISAILAVTFLGLFISFFFLSKRIEEYRDKEIIPSLREACIVLRMYTKITPSLMTERQRIDFLQTKVYRSARFEEDDLNDI